MAKSNIETVYKSAQLAQCSRPRPEVDWPLSLACSRGLGEGDVTANQSVLFPWGCRAAPLLRLPDLLLLLHTWLCLPVGDRLVHVVFLVPTPLHPLPGPAVTISQFILSLWPLGLCLSFNSMSCLSYFLVLCLCLIQFSLHFQLISGFSCFSPSLFLWPSSLILPQLHTAWAGLFAHW